jgi:hypothetical protein
VVDSISEHIFILLLLKASRGVSGLILVSFLSGRPDAFLDLIEVIRIVIDDLLTDYALM